MFCDSQLKYSYSADTGFCGRVLSCKCLENIFKFYFCVCVLQFLHLEFLLAPVLVECCHHLFDVKFADENVLNILQFLLVC